MEVKGLAIVQLRAELKPSSTRPNFHIRAVFFVMD